MSNELTKNFMEFCNCSEEEAQQFLEASDNNLNDAISLFFTSEKAYKQTESSSGIRTIHESAKKTQEEGQAFYVGGSEGGGGQQVLGPKKDKKEFISSIFSSAKDHGADVLDKERYEKSTGFKAFSGNAFILGEDLNNPSKSKPADEDSDVQEEEYIVKLWSDGFSLNDGPLRQFDDPSSVEFLTSIRNGRIPPELIRTGNKKINLLLEDHKEEEYQAPPKPKLMPFSGAGNVLGHPVSQFKDSVLAQPTSSTGITPQVYVDENKPKTKVQVRLINGGKLVLELNHDHTVASIKQEIMHREPSYDKVSFTLFTSHPMKELDPSLTIKDANLINSVVIQKPCQ